MSKSKNTEFKNATISLKGNSYFKDVRTYVACGNLGDTGFPYPATYNSKYHNLKENMPCSDGNIGFKTK